MTNFYKNSSAALCAVLMSAGFSSCSDKDDEPELETKYFSIEGADYRSGEQPEGDAAIGSVQCNDRALAGGMNFISISSPEECEKFFVSVEGVDGYLEYASQPDENASSSNRYSYLIPVMYSSELGDDITMVLSARTISGIYTEAVEKHIEFVESMEGDLAINLTFENEKDVDMHLICPNGLHIYYGNRGGDVYDENGDLLGSFGLDHDSNAACSIDGLNNENIVIPEQFVMNGEYTVVVDMYRNCDSSIPTDWLIVARYKGNIIPTLTGRNPARGTYRAGAGNGDYTVVMTFKINDADGQLPDPTVDGSRAGGDYETLLGIGLGNERSVRIGNGIFTLKGSAMSESEAAKVRNHINEIAD